MARTRLALESGVANETSELRRGNKQRQTTPAPARVPVEKNLLLRFVRPRVILRAHHYCIPTADERMYVHTGAWVRCTENFTRIDRQTHETGVTCSRARTFSRTRTATTVSPLRRNICTSLCNNEDAPQGVN